MSSNQHQKWKIRWGIYSLIGLLFILSAIHLQLNPMLLATGLGKLGTLFSLSIPPDWSLLKVGAFALLETIEIAFLGTILGMILALPFAVLASRNLFGTKTTAIVRTFLAAVRSLPSLLWALIFVIMVGLGPLAGVLATMIYTMGYLAKLQYEAIEGINTEPLEAIASIGASKLQIIRFVVIPEAANNLLSQLLFMFEYNVRASTILGIVGAGGIGFYIMGYLDLLQYDKVIVLLLEILIIVLIIDYISVKIRDHYLVESRVCT